MLNQALCWNTYSCMSCSNLKLVQIYFLSFLLLCKAFCIITTTTMDGQGVAWWFLRVLHLLILLQVSKVVLEMAIGYNCPLWVICSWSSNVYYTTKPRKISHIISKLAIPQGLKHASLNKNDISLFEINETFSPTFLNPLNLYLSL
jgi:hypothetical protein